VRAQGRGPAEVAARSLSSSLRSAAARQLLLRPLPAVPVAAEQAAALRSIGTALHQLYKALTDTPNARTVGQVVNSLLDHETARNVGALAVWVQKQPQQLESALQQLMEQQQGRAKSIFEILEQSLVTTSIQLPFFGSVWSASNRVISWILKAVNNSGMEYANPATGSIAVRFTEQMEESGAQQGFENSNMLIRLLLSTRDGPRSRQQPAARLAVVQLRVI
jgi:hypothetical protein